MPPATVPLVGAVLSYHRRVPNESTFNRVAQHGCLAVGGGATSFDHVGNDVPEVTNQLAGELITETKKG